MATTKTEILTKARDALSPFVLYLSRLEDDDEMVRDSLASIADFLGWLEDVAREEDRK